MLVNNPMGSRRRRRFYHRAGVVPVPGELAKDEFSDPNFYHYEMEPFEYSDEEEFQPTSRITEGGKRRVNYITVSSLHSRLMEIIDSMIALGEAEDREKAKKDAAEEKPGQDADQGMDGGNKGMDQDAIPITEAEPKAGPSGIHASVGKAKNE